MNEDNISETSYNTSTGQDGQMSALRTRLDTRPLVEDLEMYLSGTIITIVQTDAGYVQKRKQLSKPKANSAGIHGILSYVGNVLNPQVVQGNFDDKEEMKQYIFLYEENLSILLMTNLDNWKIDEHDFMGIVDTIINAIHPFITRLYKNKERESYALTMRTHESSTVSEGKQGGGITFFGGKNK